MRKSFALLLSLLLLLSAVACTQSAPNTDAQADGPVHIVIWHDKEDDVAAVLEQSLAPLAPDITVELVRKDGLTEALKLVGNDPKSAPDMYWFAHDKIGVYAEIGILAPITDFVPVETLSAFLPTTLEAATYKGELYQLPLYYETLLFLYNKALMAEKDVPKTTEELFIYMQKTTKDGHYGFVEQHSTAYYSVPWINGFAGELIDADGNPKLDSDAVRDALTYHKKFLRLMPGEGEYSTVNTLFLEGMADSVIGGPWLVPSAREKGIELGFAEMPTVTATGNRLTPYMGVQGLQVLKVNALAKHAAYETVLQTLCDPSVGIALAEASGCAPANALAFEDERVQADEMVMMMRKVAETAKPMPNVPEMDVMWTVAGNLLVAVNMSGGDVAEETAKYQEKALKLIEAMR